MDIIGLLLGLPKSLYVNFKYFNFKNALKLPILISNKTVIKSLSGKIIIDAPLKRGILKIGFGDIGIFDSKKSRTILDLKGTIIVKGESFIGHGSKISVTESGILTLGNNFKINAESTLICSYKITFGNNCLISWENLIMDTDFHTILNQQGAAINKDKEIRFGNDVWIGCRCTILKGTKVHNNIVIAANSILLDHIEGNNQIIGGNPPRVLKEDISWHV